MMMTVRQQERKFMEAHGIKTRKALRKWRKKQMKARIQLKVAKCL